MSKSGCITHEGREMIERTPILNILTHLILLSGLVLLLLPIWLAFCAATQTLQAVNSAPVELWPGDQFFVNLREAWRLSDFGPKFVNTLIVACGVVVGKIALAAMTAFSLVFFNYRGRMLIFWVVFITLMLPLEVRIVPTYAVAANALGPFQTILDTVGITWLITAVSGIEVALEWNLLNSYSGLILPLVATATGTFLYRQFFLTIPDELVEAARMDGAGPLRFMWDILLPLSRTNMAALATIMFVYAWNQYLWPLLVITDTANYGMVAVELSDLVPDQLTTGGGTPTWHLAMAATLVVMLPPIAVVVFMQRWFVRGLINTDK
jgi:sn-glycerol 3-phosphate transport system permease protein